MIKDKRSNPLQCILVTYLVCFAFRVIEYITIHTDQGILGEAFIHKLVGIAVLMLALRYFSLRRSEIGLTGKSVIRNVLYDLLLGTAVFMIVYGIGLFPQLSKGNIPSLQVYVTSYAINDNQGKQTGLLLFVFCIVGNIINVVMEERIFYGLFVRLLEVKYSLLKAIVLSSLLFGVRYIAVPVRSLLDGEIGSTGAMISAFMLILAAEIVGTKFCLLIKTTRLLWIPMADHFFNNTVINILYVVTIFGVDKLQVVRISITQAVLLLTVLFIYWKSGASHKKTFCV